MNGGRHEQHRHVGAGLVHRLLDRPEHRHRGAVEVDALAGLLRVHAADDGGARRDHPSRVLLALGAGHALDDDLRALVEEDRHLRLLPCSRARRPCRPHRPWSPPA